MANLCIELNKLLGRYGSDYQAVYDIINSYYESGKFDVGYNDYQMFAIFFRLGRGAKQPRLQL